MTPRVEVAAPDGLLQAVRETVDGADEALLGTASTLRGSDEVRAAC